MATAVCDGRMRVAAIILAAGQGRRIGGKVAKQFIRLGGRPLIAHTLRQFQTCEVVDDLYLTVPRGQVRSCQRDIVERYHFTKVRAVVAGGKERQDSCHRCLRRLPETVGVVVVHDGVRPFLSQGLIRAVIHGAVKWGGAIAALPVEETIKEVSEEGVIVTTLRRERLWQVQTPQAFRRDILVEAFAKAYADGYYSTDEASLVERAGFPVRAVRGTPFNVKITTPKDLLLGKVILEQMRTGS